MNNPRLNLLPVNNVCALNMPATARINNRIVKINNVIDTSNCHNGTGETAIRVMMVLGAVNGIRLKTVDNNPFGFSIIAPTSINGIKNGMMTT